MDCFLDMPLSNWFKRHFEKNYDRLEIGIFNTKFVERNLLLNHNICTLVWIAKFAFEPKRHKA
jgi:hypothetical protein